MLPGSYGVQLKTDVYNFVESDITPADLVGSVAFGMKARLNKFCREHGCKKVFSDEVAGTYWQKIIELPFGTANLEFFSGRRNPRQIHLSINVKKTGEASVSHSDGMFLTEIEQLELLPPCIEKLKAARSMQQVRITMIMLHRNLAGWLGRKVHESDEEAAEFVKSMGHRLTGLNMPVMVRWLKKMDFYQDALDADTVYFRHASMRVWNNTYKCKEQIQINLLLSRRANPVKGEFVVKLGRPGRMHWDAGFSLSLTSHSVNRMEELLDKHEAMFAGGVRDVLALESKLRKHFGV